MYVPKVHKGKQVQNVTGRHLSLRGKSSICLHRRAPGELAFLQPTPRCDSHARDEKLQPIQKTLKAKVCFSRVEYARSHVKKLTPNIALNRTPKRLRLLFGRRLTRALGGY